MSGKNEKKRKKGEHLKAHAFKPGKSGNPSGRPKTPADLLRARAHSREELERAVLRIVWSDKKTVDAESKDESVPMIQRIIAKLTLRAYEVSDVKTAGFLLDRAGFPVKKDDRPSLPALLSSMPLEELLTLAKKAFEILESGDPLAGIIDVTNNAREPQDE